MKRKRRGRRKKEEKEKKVDMIPLYIFELIRHWSPERTTMNPNVKHAHPAGM